MIILAIETASETVSVSVHEDLTVLSAKSYTGPKKHAETVLALIDEALNDSGISVDGVHTVAVDIGPGSFTGIRIGVSLANSLGFSCSVPVIGVASLDAMETSLNTSDPVCTIIDARNGRVYGCIYRNHERQIPIRVYDTVDLLNQCLPETVIAGNVPGICDPYSVPDSISVGLFAFRHFDFASRKAVPLYISLSQAERVKYGK